MKRNLDEIIKSQQKMIGKNPDIFPVSLYNAFRKQLESIEIWKNKEPGVELIYIDYKDVLDHPNVAIDKIQSFLGIDLKKNEMEKCIDISLYRNKIVSTAK